MNGWKTYTVAALGVAHAGIGWYLGLHGPDTALELGLAALGLGSLRHAVASETRRPPGGDAAGHPFAGQR